VAVTTSAPSTFSMLMFGVRLLLGLHCLLLLLALRLLFLGRGDLLLRLLRELQVLLQDRQGLLGEAGQVGILPRLTDFCCSSSYFCWSSSDSSCGSAMPLSSAICFS
jgi:hypothetical protein